jgi:hypothetical protein
MHYKKQDAECRSVLRPTSPANKPFSPNDGCTLLCHPHYFYWCTISRLPEVQRDFGLNKVNFSIILLAVTFELLINTPLSDRLLKYFGIKKNAFFLVTALKQMVLVLMTNLYALVFLMFFTGILGNYTNIEIIVEADRIEARDNTKIMKFWDAFVTIVLLWIKHLYFDPAPERGGKSHKSGWALQDKKTFIL